LRSRKVKLISAIFFKEEKYFELSKRILEKRFGEIDLTSKIFDFNHTDYYKEEMGESLKKVFVSFKKLVDLEKPFRFKIMTGKIERKFLENGKRKVNIDPGYIELSKLILFSTKNYSHRIYLGKGIFAEVTLIYKNKSFQILPWTYPDYREDFAIEFFNKVRDLYKEQLREG